MEASGETFTTNAAKDLLVSRDIIGAMAGAFLGENGNRRDPLANPLYADLKGLPPMHIQVGGDETLLDDSRKLADHARGAGVDVSLEIVPEMQHVFHFLAGTAPEADAAQKVRLQTVQHPPNVIADLSTVLSQRSPLLPKNFARMPPIAHDRGATLDLGGNMKRVGLWTAAGLATASPYACFGPAGPMVPVAPGPGKSFQAFAADQTICEQYADAQVAPQAASATYRAIGTALSITRSSA